jgi:hypothetical protein
MTCFQSIYPQNIAVLWLTPLFRVDYTRVIARSIPVHSACAVTHSRGFGPPGFSERNRSECPENTRGRLGHEEPLRSVERVSLQERIDRWVSQGLAWLLRKWTERALGNSREASAPRPKDSNSAIPLHRDPGCGLYLQPAGTTCGTYVLPEISFPLEQSGQMLHFRSAECRARYQGSSQRAASA